MNEKILELEEQLETMSAKKVYFIYVATIMLLVFLSWNLFGQNLSEEVASKKDEIVSLEEKINKNRIRSLSKAIAKTQKENLTLKDELDGLGFQEKFISNELSSLELYNQSGITNILNDILSNSIKHHIDLKVVEYTYKESVDTTGVHEKVYIKVSGDGSYKNIAGMINAIDNIKSLLKVEHVDIFVDDNMSTSFDLGLYQIGIDI